MTVTVSNLDRCVHCGLCLQSCPTYIATSDEADSPRGRIVLMQAINAGRISMNDAEAVRHLDRCLGCRGCESACPSGVEYGRALESIRARITHNRGIPFIARAILTLMAEPIIRRPFFALSRLFRPFAGLFNRAFGNQTRMLKATRMKIPNTNYGIGTGKRPGFPRNEFHTEAVVFTGCIMEGLFSHVNRATARTLSANGYRCVAAPSQGCCGALHMHSGLDDEAKTLARANIEALNREAPGAVIIVNSAGCGAMLKEYADLFADDAFEQTAKEFSSRVLDISEALARVGPIEGAPLPLTVAVDPPCHQLHAQRIDDAPGKVLGAIPKLKTVSPPNASECCGSAGIYSLLEPALSSDVLARKLDAIESVSPDLVATGNPGCIMHIGAGMQTRKTCRPVIHPVELLDLSYEKAGYYAPSDKGD